MFWAGGKSPKGSHRRLRVSVATCCYVKLDFEDEILNILRVDQQSKSDIPTAET